MEENILILNTSKIIISISVVVTAIIIKLISNRIIKSAIRKFEFKSPRKAIIVKIINFLLFLITGIVFLGVWEVDTNDLVLYFVSIFTVIGIAFFAQWSHLSNITAGIIIFFTHPARVSDSISILDGDITIVGKIVDMGLFFVTMLSSDENKILISNTLFLQKVVSVNSIKKPRNSKTRHIDYKFKSYGANFN